jgi:ribonuclease P protein component
MSLPKINRIKKKKDFEIIFKNSKSFKNNLFIFKIVKNSLGLNRFGFVVSSKVSKKAVVRNKLKRRLSGIIKAEEKNIKPGADLIIIALPGSGEKNFSEIKEAICGALIKSGLIAK